MRGQSGGKDSSPKNFPAPCWSEQGGHNRPGAGPCAQGSPSISRHYHFPPLLALWSMNLGWLPLHDFAASIPETQKVLRFLCRFVNCFKQEMTLCLEKPPSTCKAGKLGGSCCLCCSWLGAEPLGRAVPECPLREGSPLGGVEQVLAPHPCSALWFLFF